MPRPAPTVAVFDLGNVLIDWNPRHLYRKLFGGDDAAMEQFLATVCTQAWNEQQDAGRSFAEAVELLCAKEVPALGGDTMFVSMAAAYEGLSPRLQAFIDGLVGIHDLKPFRQIFSDSTEDRETLQHFERLYPPQRHPVVRVHPRSGRKVLFVNPQFTIAIQDMDERESRSLLDTLFQQALIPEYQFRHGWAPHTIAMWDNRAVQHYAVNDYYPQRRIMERVTIKGGPVTGPAPADADSVRKAKILIPEGIERFGGHKPHR